MFIGKNVTCFDVDFVIVVIFCFSVKPAVFDLILTIAIVLYLGTVYFVIQNFPFVYAKACSLTKAYKL